MSANFPYGGQEIADLRAKRQRPADMVLVSLIGPLREVNPVVMERPDRRYDWAFLAGLELLLVVKSSIEKALVKRAADAILAVDPEYLGVWFADKSNGVNVAYGCWQPSAKSCRMMGISDRRLMAGIGGQS